MLLSVSKSIPQSSAAALPSPSRTALLLASPLLGLCLETGMAPIFMLSAALLPCQEAPARGMLAAGVCVLALAGPGLVGHSSAVVYRENMSWNVNVLCAGARWQPCDMHRQPRTTQSQSRNSLRYKALSLSPIGSCMHACAQHDVDTGRQLRHWKVALPWAAMELPCPAHYAQPCSWPAPC